jgi:DNA-binding FadR family transcriptional regulator
MAISGTNIDQQARVKYLGVVAAIEADIKSHQFKAGDKLPPQRRIAISIYINM